MYKEVKNKLDKLVRENGEFVVKSAIDFVMDNGRCNITPESIAECKKDIQRRDEINKQKGNVPFVSAEFENAIVDVAFEIKDIDNAELLVYIQDHFDFDVGQKTVSKDRLSKLANVALDYMYEDVSFNANEFMDCCDNYGIYEDELIALGWEDVVNECCKNEPDKNDTEREDFDI